MNKLPAQYNWLKNIGTLPRMVTHGIDLLGTKEVIGSGSNRTILAWRDILNQRGVRIIGYSDDSVPFCGLFLAFIAFFRKEDANEVPTSPLWALNWLNYGTAVDKAMLGDVLVFKRTKGGHVGLYIAEDKTHYHVLGSNQSDNTNIMRIAKNRCVGIRRPKYQNKPESVKSYVVAPQGNISQNEA
jgi:uncharacterized protein (TIGR02594 family)